jgi:hypothetical protein
MDRFISFAITRRELLALDPLAQTKKQWKKKKKKKKEDGIERVRKGRGENNTRRNKGQ